MDELDALAAELRRELGDPPDTLPGAFSPGVRPERGLPRASLAAAALVLVSLACLVVVALRWRGDPRADATPRENVRLAAEAMQGPYRLEDGSTIQLATGARGRLAETAAGAHFDLHSGRAVFDVVRRANQRWVVAAGGVEVVVLGTRFSVALGPRGTVDVEVERGRVAVRAPGRGAPIELAVGERLRSEGTRITIERLDAGATAGRAAPAPTSSDATAAAPGPSSSTGAEAPVDWRTLFAAQRYPQALARAKALGFDRLAREADAQTLAELADVARLGGDPALAASCLLALERRFPGSPQATAARFLLGRVYVVQGNGAAATAAFEEYLRRSPDGGYASEALGRLMELYSARGERSRAEAAARRYLGRAPQGPYRALARSLLERP